MKKEQKLKMIGIRITQEQDKDFELCIDLINNDSTENRVSKSAIMRECMLNFISRTKKKYSK